MASRDLVTAHLLPASALAAGPAPWPGIVSHLTAAFAHGMPLIGPVPRPHLTVSRTFRGQVDKAWVQHWGDVRAEDIVFTPDGHPVTALLRTLIDCVRILPIYGAVVLMDWALKPGRLPRDQVEAAVEATRGPGCGNVRRALRLSDSRSDASQESVGRVALGFAGMPAIPQFRLSDDPRAHRFDLGLPWAKTVIDLQSKEYHSEWEAVLRDIENHSAINERRWRLVWSEPKDVLPDPEAFVRKVMEVVVHQPGPRCSALRRRWVDIDGKLIWPTEVNRPRAHRRTRPVTSDESSDATKTGSDDGPLTDSGASDPAPPAEVG